MEGKDNRGKTDLIDETLEIRLIDAKSRYLQLSLILKMILILIYIFTQGSIAIELKFKMIKIIYLPYIMPLNTHI